MEAVFEAEIVIFVSLLFMTRFPCFFISKSWKNKIKEGYISHIFGFEVKERIWETETVLEAETNFGIYGPIWSFYTSKCSQKYIKGGYLSHLLGFEVTELI